MNSKHPELLFVWLIVEERMAELKSHFETETGTPSTSAE
jgi:hypothetical protein